MVTERRVANRIFHLRFSVITVLRRFLESLKCDLVLETTGTA